MIMDASITNICLTWFTNVILLIFSVWKYNFIYCAQKMFLTKTKFPAKKKSTDNYF